MYSSNVQWWVTLPCCVLEPLALHFQPCNIAHMQTHLLSLGFLLPTENTVIKQYRYITSILNAIYCDKKESVSHTPANNLLHKGEGGGAVGGGSIAISWQLAAT